jgi:hypothetical protein
VAEAGAVLAATGDGGARTSFEEDIAWLQQRRFFVPDQPAGLEADPVALVGLALGLATLEPASDARAWLAGIVRGALERESDVRRADLLRLALAFVEDNETNWAALSPLVQAALAKKGTVLPPTEAYREVLHGILNAEALEPEWAVLNTAALDTLFAMEAAIDIAQVTVGQVVELLQRVPAALKRWPWEKKPKTQHASVTAQRWDIQHEYHVQSLLWALLRPVLPGLEDEENLPSVGHKHPRADLLVRALRLVIEVKYLREASQAARARVIEEIAADTALYFTGDSEYDRMIAFIWDATGSTHHHDELAIGLRKLSGITAVVIVSRPGEWASELLYG